MRVSLRIFASVALLAGLSVAPPDGHRPPQRHLCEEATDGRAPRCSPATFPGLRAYRPFSPWSFWNRPLPRNAPLSPHSKQILSFIKTTSSTDYIHLSGASSSGRWGNPIYWADPLDKAYRIRNSCSLAQPPEFQSVRIPSGAKPDPTPDASMTVYDLVRGRVYGLFRAVFHRDTHTWSSCGGSVYYIFSDGLSGELVASNEPRNQGHRGVPPSLFAVRYDEVRARTLSHVLKISVNMTRCSHVFPLVAHECETGARYAPSEGTRIRIKPSVDLTNLGLSGPALIVARALKHYGALIADQSGGPISLKLENTVAEGRGWRWRGVLNANSLARIPLRFFQVLRFGYRE